MIKNSLLHFCALILIGSVDDDEVGLNKYDLLASLNYAKTINQVVFIKEGMFEAYIEASKIYELLDASDNIGVAYRPGAHSIEVEDIERLLDFGDQLFRNIKSKLDFKKSYYND